MTPPDRLAAALSDGYASRVKEIHTAVALTPAAVAADVKAGPIVDRSNYRRGSLVGSRWKVRGDRRCCHCNGTNRAQQEFFHRIFPLFVAATF